MGLGSTQLLGSSQPDGETGPLSTLACFLIALQPFRSQSDIKTTTTTKNMRSCFSSAFASGFTLFLESS